MNGMFEGARSFKGEEEFRRRWKAVTAFVTKWATGDDCKVVLPLDEEGKYDFVVEWGDGSSSSVRSEDGGGADCSKVYAQPGTYIISINGLVDGFAFGKPEESGRFMKYTERGRNDKIQEVLQWGCVRVKPRMFYQCKNLTCSATDVPDLSGVSKPPSQPPNLPM